MLTIIHDEERPGDEPQSMPADRGDPVDPVEEERKEAAEAGAPAWAGVLLAGAILGPPCVGLAWLAGVSVPVAAAVAFGVVLAGVLAAAVRSARR
jgi:hypothetical protein